MTFQIALKKALRNEVYNLIFPRKQSGIFCMNNNFIMFKKFNPFWQKKFFIKYSCAIFFFYSEMCWPFSWSVIYRWDEVLANQNRKLTQFVYFGRWEPTYQYQFSLNVWGRYSWGPLVHLFPASIAQPAYRRVLLILVDNWPTALIIECAAQRGF